jgi:hypothetical protein
MAEGVAMYSEPHPQSSGERPDTTILHCRRCGWACEPFKMGTTAMVNRCPGCGDVLHFINYHAATETPLAKSVLAVAQRAARARQSEPFGPTG